ncbi:hypothetical protein EBU71_06465 [bacterium]|nr:hypothetical protein [Candidatus Elulimicrobium humile]
MANYRKSFNLRNGVQVDDDNFIVNANGLVGIGTSIPREFLDVRGNVQVVGLVTTNTLYAGIATVRSLTVTQGASITGVVTATSFSGSASGLTDIYAIAVDGWYINSGTISTTSKVGIGTTSVNGQLQIGTGITFNSNGNATYSGIVTAGTFSGSGSNLSLINADNISSGTLNNSRLPLNISVGIITTSSGFFGTLTGNVVGVASTASSITQTANITINSINSGFSTSGISTVHTTLHVLGNIGVGTLNPNSQIHIRKSGISSIQLTSDGSNSSEITFGRSVNLTTNNAQLRFGNTNPTYLYSTEQSLDIINYDTGNLNFYLNPGGSGTGSYNWFKPSLGRIMTLTSSGNLGINSDSPSSRLSVVGDVHVSGATTTSTLTVNSTSTFNGNSIFTKIGVSTSNPQYDIQVGRNPLTSFGVGISSSGDINSSGTIKSSYINSGIITASNGFTSGTGSPVQISVNGTELTFTVPGVGSTVLTLS